MTRKCEKCSGSLWGIDTLTYSDGRDLCTVCRASQARSEVLGTSCTDSCAKCGTELGGSGNAALIGQRLCSSCRAAENPHSGIDAFKSVRCERCGASLTDFGGTLVLGHRLCPSCQACELGEV